MQQSSTLLVVGRVRYRRESGFGPFKKDHWVEEPFRVQLEPDRPVEPATYVLLRSRILEGKCILEGTLKKQNCLFAELAPSNGIKRATFVMTTIRNVELSGTVELVEEKG
jgi:hypothetical protein